MADNGIRHHNAVWVQRRADSLRGKKRTAAQKEKMGLAQKKRFAQTGPTKGSFKKGHVNTEEACQLIRETLIGRSVSRDTRNKISKSLMGHIGANKGGTLTEEVKEKLRIAAVKRIREGRQNKGRGRCGKFYSVKNEKELHFRSFLERDFYILLEQQSSVVHYSVEPVAISYIWKEETHFYLPDLCVEYTDGSFDLIEIKPEFAWDNPQNIAKWESAKAWCRKKSNAFRRFRVFGYDKLRSMA